MAAIECEFQDVGRVLVALLRCSGEPQLKSGRQGWYQVSDHLPWRLNWCLQVRCTIAEPKEDYKLPLPANSSNEMIFDPNYCGKLNIDERHLALSIRVPDCLDPPKKKSFIWQRAIFLAGRPFHCQVKLVMIDPGDGSYLRRTAATPMRAGGIQFVSSGASGESVLADVPDSNARGRSERIEAKARELRSKAPMGNTNIFKIMAEASAFVDSHPPEAE